MNERKKVFITVKTYPHPSNTYREIVCTAGIDEQGNFIRLYPLPYRMLNNEEQFKKYQWIEVDTTKSSKDPRPESFHVAHSTLKALEWIEKWDERNRIVLSSPPQYTMCELQKDAGRLNRSLAIIKPARIVEFIAKPDSRDWSPSQQETLRQTLFWDTGNSRPLRKIPYTFLYHYKCLSDGCKGHTQTIYDWETYRLYLRLIDNGETEESAVSKVKQKYFDQMCSDKFDMHLFVGTHSSFPSWIIIGTYTPPNKFPAEKKGQMTLWSVK